MNFRQIRYFTAIQESGSILAASRHLNVSPPALSKRLRDLEVSLGGSKLFMRHARGMILTDFGKLFFAHSKEILAAVERAREAFPNSSRHGSVVSIGATPAPSRLLVPELLERARKSTYRLRITAHQAASQELQDKLTRREVDAIFSFIVPQLKKISVHPLYSEECHLIGLPNQILKLGDEIAFNAVCKLPLIMDPTTHITRRQIDRIALRRKRQMNIVAEIEPWEAKKSIIYELGCFAVLPYSSCLDEVVAGDLSAIRIVDPTLPVTLNLISHSNAPSDVIRKLCLLADTVVAARIAKHDLRWMEI